MNGYNPPPGKTNYATTEDVFALSKPGKQRYNPGLPHSAENGVNYIVIDTSKASLSNTLAHELMHVLLASGHLDADHPRKSLFFSGASPLDYKRLAEDKQIGPFRKSGNETIFGKQDTSLLRQWIPQ